MFWGSVIRLSELLRNFQNIPKTFRAILEQYRRAVIERTAKIEKTMEGTWDVRVTFRNCQTGAPVRTVRAMNTFACSGTLVETGARTTPNPGSLGHGTWRHLGGQNYSAVLRFFRFSQDGSIAEMQKITRHIELSDDGKEFTSTASLEVFDTDDSLIRTNCATETARRLE